jgi:hypothetical protein
MYGMHMQVLQRYNIFFYTHHMNLLKQPDNALVSVSTLSYLIAGALLVQVDGLWAVGLVVMGCIAALHHRYPAYTLIRVADWLSAIVLLCGVAVLIKTSPLIPATLSVAALCLGVLWLVSFVSFRYTYFSLYNLTHAIWHTGSAFFIHTLITM